MESQRQQKFARLIQKDLGDIFLHDTKGMFNHAFITVTTVRVSPDLGVANVYLSFLAVKDKNATLDAIREEGKQIRMALSNRIRKQVRIIPELRFFLDNSAEEAIRMESLISGLNIPKKEPEKEPGA
ncbi:MAG: 30S ribosome-binding factor RbfA [Bacteroidota bacterium]